MTASVTKTAKVRRDSALFRSPSRWRELVKALEKYELLHQRPHKGDSNEDASRYLEGLAKRDALLSDIFRLTHIGVNRERRKISLMASFLLKELADSGISVQEIARLRQRFQEQLTQHLLDSYAAGIQLNPPKLGEPKLSPAEKRKREPLIVEIIFAVGEIAKEINARLNDAGSETDHPLCIEYLILLANGRKSLPVTSLQRERRTKKSDASLWPHDLVLAQELLKRLANKNAQNVKKLEALNPSLTYREVLTYYLRECDIPQEEKVFFARCFPTTRYCPLCGTVFSPSKGHPLQLFCGSTCAARARQRRYRRAKSRTI